MLKPSLDSLVKRVDSKYTLVVLAAKRARELTNGKQAVIETSSNKPVSIALDEISKGRLKFERAKVGIK